MTDFVARLCQIAGNDVAQKVVSEFGGRQVYVKRTVDERGMVRCATCANPVIKGGRGPYCPKTGHLVSLNHRRVCQFHRPVAA